MGPRTESLAQRRPGSSDRPAQTMGPGMMQCSIRTDGRLAARFSAAADVGDAGGQIVQSRMTTLPAPWKVSGPRINNPSSVTSLPGLHTMSQLSLAGVLV